MMEKYNSDIDTYYHKVNICNVICLLFIPELYARADEHDNSKLEEPEKSIYDEFIPKLRTAKYGTPEYEQIKKDMRIKGGDHHNKFNRHHPEYFEKGVSGMNLLDFMEMVCDWFAASLRSDTSFLDGLDGNVSKYGIPPMMRHIIMNTYYDVFQKFEYFMKNDENPKERGDLCNYYKLIAYENCKKGLYNEATRDFLLHNLDLIMSGQV